MTNIQRQPCSICGFTNSLLPTSTMHELDERIYCEEHYTKKITELADSILVTSTPLIEGRAIKKYINFDSIEVVMGTGLLTEFSGNFSDLLGERVDSFETKLYEGKNAALKALKFKANRAGGNAIVGLNLNYVTFSGNKIGIIASGTFVLCE